VILTTIHTHSLLCTHARMHTQNINTRALTAIPLSNILLQISSPEHENLTARQQPRCSGSLGVTTRTVAMEENQWLCLNKQFKEQMLKSTVAIRTTSYDQISYDQLWSDQLWPAMIRSAMTSYDQLRMTSYDHDQLWSDQLWSDQLYYFLL